VEGRRLFEKLAEISGGSQETAAIPTEGFAIDEPDDDVGEQGLDFL